MYVAVTRLDLEGNEIGADINEKIDIFQALEGYTYMGAYAMGLEDRLGSLEAGKLADIAVIDGRIFDEPSEKLLERKALLTMMDGRVVYKEMCIRDRNIFWRASRLYTASNIRTAL